MGKREVIRLNGREEIPWRPGMTVRDLLRLKRFSFPHIVVSINGEIVPHDAYDTTLIPAGADVRAIHLMAGG